MDASLRKLPRQNIPEVLVGYENSDDAGVYLLTPELALVQTIDFFSPVVDDPYTYGQIAAANALSDVYAMGGLPRTALSVVAFPSKGVEFSVLGDIMRGGLDKLNEAGVALVGGHSVRDEEIKFGYAVTGIVNVSEIKQNNNARAGSAILLTKPLGTGLVTTAIKKGKALTEPVTAAVQSMSQLNRRPAQICVDFEVDTMTDVTGYGLVGHAIEVAKASHISIEIDHRKLPLLPGALDYSKQGLCAGGLTSNREFYSRDSVVASSVAREFSDIVFDPQTSGGLLVFVADSKSGKLLERLHAAGFFVSRIGRTVDYAGTLVSVI